MLKKIINALINVGKIIINVIKSGKVKEATENLGTIVTGAGTIAVASVVAINTVKSHMMAGNSNSAKSEPATPSSAEARIKANRMAYEKMLSGEPDLSEQDKETLEEVSKTRDVYFQASTTTEKIETLKEEGFDFNKYRADKAKRNKKYLFGLIKKNNSRSIGEATSDKEAFRTPVDYGWFNIIARPLDDIICFLKDDPKPKYVEQVEIIDFKTPFMNLPYQEARAVLRECGPFLSKQLGLDIKEPTVNEIRENKIFAEELCIKGRSFKETKRRIDKRMKKLYEGDLRHNLFDLIDEEMKSEKKEKKKKKKHKKDKNPEGGKKNKEPKGKLEVVFGMEALTSKPSKKQLELLQAKATKRAKDMMSFHMENAKNGIYEYGGYKLDKALL